MVGRLPRALAPSLLVAASLAPRAAGAVEPPPPAPAPAIAAPDRDPTYLELSTRGGFGGRVGSASGLPITSRLGGVFGLGIAFHPLKRVSIGLGWERSGLGSERGIGELADMAVDRTLDAFWATLRVAVLRSEEAALIVQIAPGLAVQRAAADVLVYPDSTLRPSVHRCSASGGPSFGVRVGVGGEAHIAGPLWATADALFDHVQLSSDPLDDCAPGAGSLAALGLRAGLAFRFDVTRWTR